MYNNINLVYSQKSKFQHSKRQKRSLPNKIIRLFLFILAAYFCISFILSFKVVFSQHAFNTAIGKLPVVNQIKNIFNADLLSDKEDDDRLNILLMGIGGVGHDGGYLTDTIILVSIKPSTHEAVMISIPRDLYIKIPGNGWQRINHASAYGELNNYSGGGSALTAKTVEETFNLKIDYWLRIDFSGFKQLIDDLGGIDVYVDRSFTDQQYPTQDFGVQTISFKQGLEHMNGERALQFTRSRHGNNGEGSDFARSKRQQKILLAVKDKVLSWGFLTSPSKIYKIYKNIDQHLQTNISLSETSQLLSLVKKVDFSNLQHYVIDDSPGGLLKPIITEDGAQVLVPKSGDLTELRDFVRDIFDIQQFSDQHISLIIVNGTSTDGLATFMSSVLGAWGFETKKLATAPHQDFEKTVIYNLKPDQHPIALKILKTRLKANVANKIPDFLTYLLPASQQINNNQLSNGQDGADFLIVLGADQQRAIKYILEWQAEQARIEAEKVNQEKNSTEDDSTNQLPQNKTEEIIGEN